jgi:hypothetical protein
MSKTTRLKLSQKCLHNHLPRFIIQFILGYSCDANGLLEAISKGPPLKIKSMGHPAMLGKSFGPISLLVPRFKSSQYASIPAV